MKFVVDENATKLIVDELRQAGHTVFSLHEPPLKGMKNGEVYELAVKEKAILITRDQHFLNPLRYATKNLTGLVFIRAGNLSGSEECKLVSEFIASFPLEKLQGKRQSSCVIPLACGTSSEPVGSRNEIHRARRS